VNSFFLERGPVSTKTGQLQTKSSILATKRSVIGESIAEEANL
jgi:hypothetical protein